jgi:hypothetical protein
VSHFDEVHRCIGVKWREDGTSMLGSRRGVVPPNSPESFAIARALWHQLNPGKEYPTIPVSDQSPIEVRKECAGGCGARVAGRMYCKACAADRQREHNNNRRNLTRGVAAMAERARKYPTESA